MLGVLVCLNKMHATIYLFKDDKHVGHKVTVKRHPNEVFYLYCYMHRNDVLKLIPTNKKKQRDVLKYNMIELPKDDSEN